MVKTAIFYTANALVFIILTGGCRPAVQNTYKLKPGDALFGQVKVAAISFEPEKFNVEANVEKLEKLFRWAAEKDVQLALAPEGVIEGYVVIEIIKGKFSAERMRDVAITIDDPIIRRFRNLAAELNMCLAFSFAERIDDDVFNCAIFIDNNGKIRGKYHKMQFYEGYHRSWWYNRLGKKSRAFDTPFGRCGFLICNDRWNPALARIPVLDGAQFLLIPSFGSRGEHQDKAVLARARENGVPIVEANVGVTLIISKGEIVEVSREVDAITVGTIAIPMARSARNRDAQEQLFLEWRQPEMQKRYKDFMKK